MRKLVACLALAAACAGGRANGRFEAAEFRGREVVRPTIEVPLVDGEEDTVGLVQVGSSGAFRTQLGRPRAVPVVHVRLSVRNVGVAQELRVPLDQLRLEGTWDEPLRPAAIFAEGRGTYETSVTVPPGEARDVDVVFELPARQRLDRIPGFVLTWGVDAPGNVLRERTAFRPAGRGGGDVARAFRPVSETF